MDLRKTSTLWAVYLGVWDGRMAGSCLWHRHGVSSPLLSRMNPKTGWWFQIFLCLEPENWGRTHLETTNSWRYCRWGAPVFFWGITFFGHWHSQIPSKRIFNTPEKCLGLWYQPGGMIMCPAWMRTLQDCNECCRCGGPAAPSECRKS